MESEGEKVLQGRLGKVNSLEECVVIPFPIFPGISFLSFLFPPHSPTAADSPERERAPFLGNPFFFFVLRYRDREKKCVQFEEKGCTLFLFHFLLPFYSIFYTFYTFAKFIKNKNKVWLDHSFFFSHLAFSACLRVCM